MILYNTHTHVYIHLYAHLFKFPKVLPDIDIAPE